MKSTLLLTTLFFINSQLLAQHLVPPVAKKVPHTFTEHGNDRLDNYFWMRLSDEQKEAEKPDEQTQDVLDYLAEENEHLEMAMSHTNNAQKALYEELVGRQPQDMEYVPVSKNGYTYTDRFEEGENYSLNCRTKNSEGAEEEIILNQPELAKNHIYFSCEGLAVSTNNKLLAYAVDTVARGEYTIYIKDLKTGKLLEDRIDETSGDPVWANDNKHIFYSKKDPQTLRSYQIYRHRIGTDAKNDVLVYEEKDETFYAFVYKSKSEKYLFIGSGSTLSSEYHYLDASKPTGKWKVVQKRKDNLEYGINHFGDDFYITTNHEAKNFRLMKAPVSSPAMENWVEVIPHREAVLLTRVEPFKDYLVVEERKDGLTQLRIIRWSDWSAYELEFNDPAYTCWISDNEEFDSGVLRYGYTSLTTPWTVYEIDMDSHERKLLKQYSPVDPDFSPDNYISERIYATARDGVKIPISLVYKKGTVLSADTPLLLNGYGSYGSNFDPEFSSSRLSLLDRGFVYAIPHVRGGQEMGRHWYEDGKLLKKKNTFYDFIDCADFLIEKQYTSADHLHAWGGSAGGLLMGAVMNMRPELWRSVVARVPFVDVISTMMDETIPLTTGEFDEWGNPKDKTYYDYMLSYSPYDNIEKKAYPNLLITTGFWDEAVQYWEPAKYTAKLRANKTDDNMLLLSCNMNQGHGGGSGRFGFYGELALAYAFMLDLEGISVNR